MVRRSPEALEAGVVDCLCSDYWPASLLHAPWVLAERHGLDLAAAYGMLSAAPRRALGLPPAPIAQGEPLTAALTVRDEETTACAAVWRAGRLVYATWGCGMWWSRGEGRVRGGGGRS